MSTRNHRRGGRIPRRAAIVVTLVAAAACGTRSFARSSPAGSDPARPAAGQDRSPVVVLVSLDGFHPAYLERFEAPNLTRLASRGVRARWMTPVFPANTFPGHYSIVTGLLPTHHGIVDNHFVDPADGTRFRYSAQSVALQSRWWHGEPLWTTAQRQGLRAASFFWPGSDVDDPAKRPGRWKLFDVRFPPEGRVDTVLSWLALPLDQRPHFVTLYFSDVDHWGHETGPESPELGAAVRRVDRMIGRLVTGIERLGLTDVVNLVVVSDHGMAPLSRDRVVVLDDYLDRERVYAVSLGATISLRPGTRRNAMPAESIVTALRRAPHVSVYLREETPERWRYRDSPLVSDVVGVPDAGWVLTTRAALAGSGGNLRGAHGFDNADSTMRALFVAAGPAFRRGAVVEPFSSLHVYELICRVLGIRPAPNDGSLDSVAAVLR